MRCLQQREREAIKPPQTMQGRLTYLDQAPSVPTVPDQVINRLADAVASPEEQAIALAPARSTR
jgi:hypothetical protein